MSRTHRTRAAARGARRTALTMALTAASVTAGASLAACDRGGQDPVGIAETGETVNSIPLREFNQVAPPTYDAIAKAFTTVTAADPTLKASSPRLARAVFDEIKRQSGGSRSLSPFATADATVAATTAASGGALLRLTVEEWKVVLTNPFSSLIGMDVPSLAESTAQQTYACDATTQFEDDKADALRHAYWNAVTARRVAAVYGTAQGLQFAQDIATAHETGADLSSRHAQRARAMDLSNNAAGRKVFAANPTATESQLLQLVQALRFEYVDDTHTIVENPDRLVYFSGHQSYDVTYVGAMSNPDSGSPWTATFDLNQCGTTIRGGFLIVRGPELQRRRFTGTVSGPTLTLRIDEPFQYENPRGLPFCMGMVAQLASGASSLSGTWASTNCRLGGTITLTAQ